jgi:hypothetical protein
MATSNRAVVRVQMESGVKASLDKLCKDKGMAQVTVMSRLVKWFIGQNPVLQASILGQLSSKTQKRLAWMILERTAGSQGDGPQR